MTFCTRIKFIMLLEGLAILNFDKRKIIVCTLLVISLAFNLYNYNKVNELIDKNKRQNHNLVLETITYMESYFTELIVYLEEAKKEDFDDIKETELREQVNKNFILMTKMSDNIDPHETSYLFGEDDKSLEVYNNIKNLVDTISLMRVSPPLFMADLNRLGNFAENNGYLEEFLVGYRTKVMELKETLDYKEPGLTQDEKKIIIEKTYEMNKTYWQWREDHIN